MPNGRDVEAFTSLFEGRRTWSPPGMRGARVWQSSLAYQVHVEALLEDLARRGGPRTAREYSERDWNREVLSPAVLAANVAAWNQHRLEHTSPPRAPGRRRALPKWRVAMALHLGGDDA